MVGAFIMPASVKIWYKWNYVFVSQKILLIILYANISEKYVKSWSKISEKCLRKSQTAAEVWNPILLHEKPLLSELYIGNPCRRPEIPNTSIGILLPVHRVAKGVDRSRVEVPGAEVITCGLHYFVAINSDHTIGTKIIICRRSAYSTKKKIKD